MLFRKRPFKHLPNLLSLQQRGLVLSSQISDVYGQVFIGSFISAMKSTSHSDGRGQVGYIFRRGLGEGETTTKTVSFVAVAESGLWLEEELRERIIDRL